MAEGGGVIYEVTLEVAPSRIEAFDAWLPGHVQALLAQPGFETARIQRDPERAGDGWRRRVVSYRLRDRQALDDYLAGAAERMRAEGVERFGKHMRASRRILEVRGQYSQLGQCENCRRPLYDDYCQACGQRRDSPVRSLPRLSREALDHLFNADSRIWRSLRDLLLRPGLLTRRYLDGGRVHYTPPFRLYILLSLLFFLSLTVIGGQNLPVFQFGGMGNGELEATGEGDERIEEKIRRCLTADMNLMTGNFAGLEPERLSRRLRGLCIQVVTGDSQGVFRQVMGNASTALFLFLPLMAAYMRLIYPLSGKWFISHLLFLTHFQAFLFLLLLIMGAFTLAASALAVPADWILWTWLAGLGWSLIWLARGLKRVYTQGYFLTSVKFLLMSGAYLLALPLLITALLIWTVAGF